MNLTRDQVRELDRRAIEECGIPALCLMENAGRGAVDVLEALGIHGPLAICCGKGNNGGDGLVMARHLHNRGRAVAVYLFANPAELSREAAVHWQIVSRMAISTHVWRPEADAWLAEQLTKPEWIVDALYGTGLAGPVRPPHDRVIAALEREPGCRLRRGYSLRTQCRHGGADGRHHPRSPYSDLCRGQEGLRQPGGAAFSGQGSRRGHRRTARNTF